MNNSEQKTYPDLMVDIETLDTTATATIMSIAAVPFDLVTGDTSGDPFHVTLDFYKQIEQGRTTSIETILWWGGQYESVQLAVMEGKADLLETLLSLTKYIIEHMEREFCIWSNSPSFDLAILKNAYGRGMDVPWTYKQERDVRTILEIAKRKGCQFAPASYSHIPLDDALEQISKVHKAYKHLEK